MIGKELKEVAQFLMFFQLSGLVLWIWAGKQIPLNLACWSIGLFIASIIWIITDKEKNNV